MKPRWLLLLWLAVLGGMALGAPLRSLLAVPASLADPRRFLQVVAAGEFSLAGADWTGNPRLLGNLAGGEGLGGGLGRVFEAPLTLSLPRFSGADLLTQAREWRSFAQAQYGHLEVLGMAAEQNMWDAIEENISANCPSE